MPPTEYHIAKGEREMVINRKSTGLAASMPVGLLAGGLVSLASTLLLTGGLAKLLDAEILREESMGYGVMGMLFISAFAGSVVSCKKIKHRHLMTAALSGIVYLVILLSITALFFGGQYSAVGVTAILIFCGSAAAAMVFSGVGRGRKTARRKRKNR